MSHAPLIIFQPRKDYNLDLNIDSRSRPLAVSSMMKFSSNITLLLLVTVVIATATHVSGQVSLQSIV